MATVESINDPDGDGVTNSEAEYSYTKRNEFTSEIYKIEVRNLGIFGIGEFKKLLKKQFSLIASKIKSPKRRDFAYVCFRSQEDQEKAIAELDGYVWKGKTLKVTVAKAIPDPLIRKRREEQESNIKCTNDGTNTNANFESKKCKSSIEATCPLASMPYSDQLKFKENEMLNILNLLGKDILKTDSSYRKYFQEHKNQNIQENSQEFNDKKSTTSMQLPCKFLGILPSSKIYGYRNKSEFTIGRNINNEIVVGFRLGSYANGQIEVDRIDNLPQIPDNVKNLVRNFENFIRQSKYDIFNPETNLGVYRQLCIRSTELNSNLMMIVGINTQGLNSDNLNELKNEIMEYYKDFVKCQKNENEIQEIDEKDHKERPKEETNESIENEGEEKMANFNLVSLYYQDMKRKNVGQLYDTYVEHLLGEKYIYDQILNLKFRISPLAFFQINTSSAEILYAKAIELSNLNLERTILLDICCGTGTIGICFAKYCKYVYGVDICGDAIHDAEYNAKMNDICNIKFYTGNANDFIQSMVKEANYNYVTKDERDLLAIVDPPRAGLHNKSILAIRNATDLKRLIYISCNPKSAKQNWIDLARPESKTYKGLPFLPKLAVAVDMFPHTTHTELIILFERIEENEEIVVKEEEMKKEKVEENDAKKD